MSVDVSEVHISSALRVEENAKQDTSMKQAASRVFMPQKVKFFLVSAVRTSA
jgi:hypothetical protein